MGVEVQTTKPGNGPTPQKGQTVSVHCTGYVVSTGKKFWSTKDPGQKIFSFQIGLGQVIKGNLDIFVYYISHKKIQRLG